MSRTPCLIGCVHSHVAKVGPVTCVPALAGEAPKELGWFSKVMESKKDTGRTCVPSPAMFPTSRPELGSSAQLPASQFPLETWFCAVLFDLPQRRIAVLSVMIPSTKHLKMRQFLGGQLTFFFFLAKIGYCICYVFISICLQVKTYTPVEVARTRKIF